MLKVSEAKTCSTADDEVENSPAKAEAAGLSREAADDLGPSLDLAQRPLEQVGAAKPFTKAKRVVQMYAQRLQVISQTRYSTRILGLQLAHQDAQTSVVIGCRSRLVEGRPVSLADAVDDLRPLRERDDHVPKSMHRTALMIAVRPQLLDRLDQTRRPIDDGQPGRSQPTADKAAPHLQPVLVALTLTQTDVEQNSFPPTRCNPMPPGRPPWLRGRVGR